MALRKKSFSKPQLLIFILVFAAIGGTLIYRSFAASSGPINITVGGTYTGDWASSGTTPAVKIATSQPVIIENSTISTTGSANLVDANYTGVNLTIRNSKFNAPATGAGQAIFAYNYKSITMEHNDINGSWGIRLDNAQSGGTVTVRYNKARNINSSVYAPHFFQTANNLYTIPIEVAWNEVISTFTQTNVEDVINIHSSSGAKVHDNYIQGAYPPTLTGGFSGSGIMIDSGGHDNEVYNNQVVDTTNVGIGISSGWNNSVHDNRVIFDGRDDSGNIFTAANVGIYAYNPSSESTWTNNHVTNNTIGWIGYDSQTNSLFRNTMYLPIYPEDYAKNTELSVSSTTHALEVAEYQLWLTKLSSNGVALGSSGITPPPPPSDGWTFCANEGGQCSFSGTMSVRYGANGTYFTKAFTNGTACDNVTFGDPVPTVTKHCDYQVPTALIPGDLNNDGHVNITDLSILLSAYGTASTTADVNKDGTVNITDLSILLSHYGT